MKLRNSSQYLLLQLIIIFSKVQSRWNKINYTLHTKIALFTRHEGNNLCHEATFSVCQKMVIIASTMQCSRPAIFTVFTSKSKRKSGQDVCHLQRFRQYSQSCASSNCLMIWQKKLSRQRKLSSTTRFLNIFMPFLSPILIIYDICFVAPSVFCVK